MNPSNVSAVINQTALAANGSFTSQWFLTDDFQTILASVDTDVRGNLYLEHSSDGVSVERTLTFTIAGGNAEAHRSTLSHSFVRIRYVNGTTIQTRFKLQGKLGDFGQLTSPLNAQIEQDADTTVVRNFDPEFTISAGFVGGFAIVTKLGRNDDIDTATTPEDVWDGGGTYTGFPTGAAEEIQAVSSSASDTGVLTFTYLASFTSTDWQTATVTLNGTTPVNSGITAVRVHTANYNSGAETTFNVGTITVRHRTTTTHVFAVIQPSRSQSYVSAYTIPFGSKGILKRVFATATKSASSLIEVALWVRERNKSPRLRRTSVVSQSDGYLDEPYGGIELPALTDIIFRVVSVTANNSDVFGGYDIVLIKNV